MAKVSVIIPAAGAGKRFGSKGNKIFERLRGQPIFIRTVEAFTSRGDVCQVQLVVSDEDMPEMKTRYGANLGFMGVSIVAGGPARTQSVRNALAGVDASADLVAVHDAVRPCIAQPWIDAVFAAAERTGAAILAYPVHGTLKTAALAESGGPGGQSADADAAIREVLGVSDRPKPREFVVASTLPRQELYEAQTPQVFRRELLIRAYAAGGEATDDACLVEQLGEPVTLVMGDVRNIKITTPADLAAAAAVIETLPKPKPIGPAGPFDDARW